MREEMGSQRRARNARNARVRDKESWENQVDGRLRRVLEYIMRERPVPIWMPLMTGMGIFFVNHCNRPV